jgi:hypothetical protein
MADLDTTNKFAVTASLQGITILKPPLGPITHDDALNLAAWLVALADHEKKFQTIVLAEISHPAAPAAPLILQRPTSGHHGFAVCLICERQASFCTINCESRCVSGCSFAIDSNCAERTRYPKSPENRQIHFSSKAIWGVSI